MASLGLGISHASIATPAYESMSVAELQAAMDRKELSSRALTAYFVARIEALDRRGPRLQSVIELNPDADAIAAALDAERLQTGARGPLHGIPLLLKDNIDTADRMLTTAGSLALLDSHPSTDAALVKRLRDAGAVLLGKTNLSEWANFRSTHSLSGWSARGGQTRNAYAPLRSPCGSSAGSAVAVAAGFAVLAVGTETDGSIVCPSSVNGVVGIKPTLGLISRRGIVPIAFSQDTAGPMARNLGDALALLRVMAASDPSDTAAPAIPDGFIGRLQLPADGGDLKGLRIGVARNLSGYHDGVDAVFESALALLRAGGAELVDPAELQRDPALAADELSVLLYEFKDRIGPYLATRQGGPKNLADLIAFNDTMRALEMPLFGQELFLQAQSKGPLSDQAYREARMRSKQAAGVDGIDAVLRAHHLDALVAPTKGPAWLIDPVLGDRGIGGAAQSAAIAGYPHISVPAGLVQGLPVGLSFIGTAWSEPQLIRMAAAFEKARGAFPAPQLTP
ncbi:amidase [Hydrocarboniphaga sp.]|uniref:amidase n=1 Tax=Hydrocarboniphaga sp. TaxID=2033016 RepID=UPI0026131AAA|nr:amidase [Hydrocarboniphaga sp.]